MFSLKFITNLFVLTLLFVSCFGQKNSVEQEQSTTFDSINDQRDFYMIIAAQQKDFFQYDNYFYYKFHNKHKKMNLIEKLKINKNDTLYIMERVTIENGNCESYAWNSRIDIGLDYYDNPVNYYNLKHIRPIFQRWNKKEIEQKGKRGRSLGGHGNWYVTRIIIQPDSLLFDGIVIEAPPHN